MTMGFRTRRISLSILVALLAPPKPKPKPNEADKKKPGVLARILAFFSVFKLSLERFREELFGELRNEVWGIEEEGYVRSLKGTEGTEGGAKGSLKGLGEGLKQAGDMGYSGSTFFTTPDSKYLIKSLPRPSEYSFFKDDLLDAYAAHMKANPDSFLVRITDFLHSPTPSIGILLGLTPSHHIVMENILYGKAEGEWEGAIREGEWETYDLKPIDYFYPERDLAGGHLASDAVKDKLVDKFEDKVRLTRDEKAKLVARLEKDTEVLAKRNVTDYSLFLVRYPNPEASGIVDASVPIPPSKCLSDWRRGVVSRDGKWVYRALLLDFFWAKHKLQPIAMTALVKSFNVLGGKKVGGGRMSITTEPGEYRERFLGMVETIVVGESEDESEEGEREE
ncbi:SAICAR synthase-like protein [Patellaria atrata CBS 101060]|uniref:SAICAR synthase-like protein n=1 Tax=Patellaria atrata CBS 101060 TaxID=1346257 RepID=A0A9P4SDL0_9PEZI|nr:SAICAR synthase-like protein [Patellaria atrata CBS 101060]